MINKRLNLNRTFRSILLFTSLYVVGVTKCFAYDFSAICSTGQTLYYNITDSENHYVQLTSPKYESWYGFTKPTGNMVLPAQVTYNATVYTVKNIGDYAFTDCGDLTSVTIPNSVTIIGQKAFSRCIRPTSLIIPNSVTNIGWEAFSGWANLKELTIGEGVSIIDDGAFWYCPQLTTVHFNAIHCNSMCTTREEDTFSVFSSSYDGTTPPVTTLTIGENVQYIPSFAFKCFSNLNSVVIPNKVTTIGEFSFYDCTDLTSITLGFSLMNIQYMAFYGCSQVSSITCFADTPAYLSLDVFTGIDRNKPVYIPTGTYGAYASAWSYYFTNFQEQDLNTHFSFTEGDLNYYVTSTHDKTVRLESHINGTSATGTITIPSTVAYGGNVFSVTEIGENAFANSTGINSVSIGNSVAYIDAWAFYRCTSLTSITIPSSTNTIDYGAFAACTSLSSVVFNNAPASIGVSAFTGCTNLSQIDFGNAVNYIGYQSFQNCTSITSIDFPNTLVTIYDEAFIGCGNLNTFTIPSSVTTVGIGSFKNTAWYNNQNDGILYKDYWCLGYKGSYPIGSLVVQDGTIGIANGAFEQCNNITSLYIPNSVLYMGLYAFSNCYGLEEINVELGNPVFDSRDNCNAIIRTDSNTLLLGCKNTVIPQSVTSIGDLAFYGCNTLTSILIPQTVTFVGNYAFYYCTGLTSIEIPNSVTSIGVYAFESCRSLKTVIVGSSIASIGSYAFRNCHGLSTFTILATTPPTLGQDVFKITYKSGVSCIYVPYESLDSYKTAQNWKNYKTKIQPMAYTTISGYGNSTESDHWTFIASPVTLDVDPTTIDGLIAETATEYDFYRLAPGVSSVWENYKAHTEGFVLENGQGYLYANKNDVNIILKGDMFNEDYKDVNLQTGWNLVGNPYGQDAYINRSYYRMNSAGDDIEAVSAYTTTQIPVCTGVVVQGASDSDFVRFTKTTPTKSTDNGSLQMTLAKTGSRGGNIQDKAIVSFDEDTQLGKFIFNEDNAKLYVPQNGEDYAIAYSNGQDDMLLYFKTKETGTYTINFENNSELKDAYLVDKFKNKMIDLCKNDSYTFIGSAVDRPDRFVIRFKNSELSDNSENSYFAYQNGNEIIINGNGELQVFDVMGRSVITQHVNGVETMGTSSLSTGVYIFRLNEKTQKILVR